MRIRKRNKVNKLQDVKAIWLCSRRGRNYRNNRRFLLIVRQINLLILPNILIWTQFRIKILCGCAKIKKIINRRSFYNLRNLGIIRRRIMWQNQKKGLRIFFKFRNLKLIKMSRVRRIFHLKIFSKKIIITQIIWLIIDYF